MDAFSTMQLNRFWKTETEPLDNSEDSYYPVTVNPKMGMGRGRKASLTSDAGYSSSSRASSTSVISTTETVVNPIDSMVEVDKSPGTSRKNDKRVCSRSQTPFQTTQLKNFRSSQDLPSKILTSTQPYASFCIRKRRRIGIGIWKDFYIQSIEDSPQLELWIAPADEDFSPISNLLDGSRLFVLQNPKAGCVALVVDTNRRRRGIILAKLSQEASFRDVDTGEVLLVPLDSVFKLPIELRCIPPAALKVVVEKQHIRNPEDLRTSLHYAAVKRAKLQGCFVTWDHVPSIIFKSHHCLQVVRTESSNPYDALGRFKNLFGIQKHESCLQKLYAQLPGVNIPACGTQIRECVVTSVNGPQIFLVSEMTIPSDYSDDLPMFLCPKKAFIGSICLLRSGAQLERGCILDVVGDDAMIQLVDRGDKLSVETSCLFEAPLSSFHSPIGMRATLCTENGAEISNELRDYLLGASNITVHIVKRSPIPEVILSNENYVEISHENLHLLRSEFSPSKTQDAG